MADISETIEPLVESLLEPGETLEGMCVGSQSGFMSSKFVVVAVTDKRLIMNATSMTIKVKTTDGEKLKLAVAKGGGPLGKLMGGPTQENGVKAVNAWLARNSQG